MAREAAPSSATSDVAADIARRMPPGAVNLTTVTSAVGRGPIQNDDGESAYRLEDDEQMNVDRRVTDTRTTDKTSDATRLR